MGTNHKCQFKKPPSCRLFLTIGVSLKTLRERKLSKIAYYITSKQKHSSKCQRWTDLCQIQYWWFQIQLEHDTVNSTVTETHKSVNGMLVQPITQIDHWPANSEVKYLLTLAFCDAQRSISHWRSPCWPGRRSECARFNSQREHQTQVPGHKATLIRSNKSEIGKKIHLRAKKHTWATRALSTRQSQRLMIFRVEAVHNRCFEEWEKSQQRSGELAPFRGASGGEFILGRTLFHAWLDDVHANVLTTMQWVEDYNNALARFKVI
jgi:hypothetical protein